MKKRQKQKTNTVLKYAGFLASLFVFVFLFSYEAQASSISADNVISLVNKERLSRGINSLVENSILKAAAIDKARDMIENDYFAHTSPAGKSPWYWIEKNGYDYKYAGENLAMNFSSASDQHEAWMKSATHKKNILNPDYKEIGVAVARGKINGDLTTVVVQLFGTRATVVSQPVKQSQIKQAKEAIAEKIQGEQIEDKVNLQNLRTLPLSEVKSEPEVAIDRSYLDAQKASKLACENGICYFGDQDGNIIREKRIRDLAWTIVVIIIIVSVAVNLKMISNKHYRSSFIAGNAVILLLTLVSMALWKT